MSAKHTPGPWRYEEHYDGYEILSSSKEMSATVATLGMRLSETGRADARLIAAAPELLAACKDALDAMWSEVSYHARMRSEASCIALRAAIAKAEQP